MKRSIRLLVLFLVAAAMLCAVVVIMTWPKLIVSEETELTGLSFQLSQVAFFDHTSVRGEGDRIWVYQLPKDAAQRLDASEDALAEYPMWSALALDGYKRIRWMSPNAANVGALPLVLKAALSGASADDITVDTVASIDDARMLARDLVTREGTLVAAWYTVANGDVITNYRVYVLNVDKRILIKLSRLT